MLNNVLKTLLILAFVTLASCSPKHSEIIVAEYGDFDIKMDEFENAYAKNVGSIEKAKEDSVDKLKDFLDLYVNFKMKLRNAEVRRLLEDYSVKNELANYEKSIGKSYFLEKELYEKGMRDLYKKRSEELRVSHILIRTDTLSAEKAEQKAKDIIKRIQEGSPFELEVTKYSDDQFSREKGGDIYYFTAGMILPEFEEMAYNTPVGEVAPEPLKTKYGYHIIKVTERIKRVPQINASHILLRNDPPTTKDGKSKKELIVELLLRARGGEDFAKLAVEYSEDPGSGQNKGNLGNFSRRQMVQPFDEAAFSLEEGEISDVVETQFGYHIIKCIAKQEYPDYESERKNLRELYERTRKPSEYRKLLDGLTEEFNYVFHDDVLKEVKVNLRDTTIGSNYQGSDFQNNFGNRTLFSIGTEKYSLDSLVNFYIRSPKSSGSSINKNNLSDILNNYKDEKLLDTKVKALVNDDNKFAQLMNEYKNGILIFKLQENEVWNKMKLDTLAIRNYYDEHKNNYVWPDRVKFSVLHTKSDSLINKYYDLLVAGENFDSLLVRSNINSTNNANSEFVSADAGPLAKAAYKLEKTGDFSKPVNTNNRWNIVKLLEKSPSHIKEFNEVRAEVTSAFQDKESARLEKAYVDRLKNLYEPELFYDELEKAFNN